MLRVVAGLAPQVDRLEVALNGYPRVPRQLARYAHVVPTLVADPNGGDAEKFRAIDDWNGYVLSCDDDVLYPPDYVAATLAAHARVGGRHVVSYHGGSTLGWTGSAAAATAKRHRCLGAVAADDLDVNVVGTGCMAWHTENVPLWRDVFRHPNMADVHMACHARTFGIPLAVLAHADGWLQDICPPGGPRIYEANAAGDGSPQDTRRHREAELGRHDWAAPAPGRPRVRVSVATCSRPELLLDLLGDLSREAQYVDLEVCVFEDPTAADYSTARAYVAAQGWAWQRMPSRYGKDEHWRLVTQQLRGCRDSTADWFVFMPDDVRLVRYALPRAIDLWQHLEDPATLTLWRLRDQEGKPNWTGRRPVQHGPAWECFHVDGMYLCQRPTLELFEWRLQRPLQRSAALSSGVGRQMSLRLYLAKRRMYRVDATLAVPVSVPSVMNPDVADRTHEWQYI